MKKQKKQRNEHVKWASKQTTRRHMRILYRKSLIFRSDACHCTWTIKMSDFEHAKTSHRWPVCEQVTVSTKLCSCSALLLLGLHYTAPSDELYLKYPQIIKQLCKSWEVEICENTAVHFSTERKFTTLIFTWKMKMNKFFQVSPSLVPSLSLNEALHRRHEDCKYRFS